MIRSDNGSNMVRASTELTRAFWEMDLIKIGNFLKENGGVQQHERNLGTPRLECKSNFKLLTEDSWK